MSRSTAARVSCLWISALQRLAATLQTVAARTVRATAPEPLNGAAPAQPAAHQSRPLLHVLLKPRILSMRCLSYDAKGEVARTLIDCLD